ncbi:MAG: DUF4093 domain-containing protein [Ruminococcaceae bacterium]|nr:DUF4093 domain-containing protein [Oscillospiraceae bacterium]
MEKIHITVPIIVEGRYDKAKLANITDAVIIPTNGFGIFKNTEKTALIRRLGKNGIILLCDSDGAGGLIRSHLKGCLNGIKVYNIYTEQIKGKEKRKSAPSKEGFLGVEGISDSSIRELLEKLLTTHPEIGGETNEPTSPKTPITKTDLYEWKLTGFPDSTSRRNKLCAALGLPRDMTPNAMLAALNMISSRDEAEELCRSSD